MEHNFSNMAQFISTLRKEKELTQKDLAEQLGVTDKAVSKWERGLSCPDISLLAKLSEILGVTTSELLKGEKAVAPAPEMEAVVESTLRYADQSTQGIKSSSKRWKSLAIIAGVLLLSVLTLVGSQMVMENGLKWLILPANIVIFLWLAVTAAVFAFGKNKIATVLFCGLLVYITTYTYTALNETSHMLSFRSRVPFIPHYGVIIALLILALAGLVTSILIRKKPVSSDITFLIGTGSLTSIILVMVTISAIMDFVDLHGLGVNPMYTILMLLTVLTDLVTLALLAKHWISQHKAQKQAA